MAKRTKQPKMPAKETPADDKRYAQAVRLVRDWTPRKLRQARERAEGGDLSGAVAVCEMLLQDDAVSSGLKSVADALFALVPGFEPSGDRRRSKRTVNALEAGEDWWEGLPESEQRQIFKWGLLLGIGLGRNRWTEKKDHGNRLLPMLEHWHPQGLRWNNAEQRWTIRDHRGIEHEVVPGDGEWFMYRPFGKNRAWAEGLWYCLAHVVLLKAYAIIDVGRVSGRISMLVAHAPPEVESTKELRQELADSLLDGIADGGDAVAALPTGWLLSAVKISDGAAELFETQASFANDAIAITIRGGNLTTNVKGGSKAATETQAKTNEVPKLKFHAESWSTAVHDDALQPWAYFNFGDAGLAPWPVYPTEPEEDRKVRADGITAVAKMVKDLETEGFELDDKAVIHDFGMGTFVKGRKDAATRQKEAAERFAMQQPPGSGAPAPADPKAPKVPAKKDDKDPKAKQGLGTGGIAMLASGDLATSAPNFLAAQLWIDDLVASAAAAGNVALEPFIEQILAEVEASESVPEVYDRLRKLAPDLSGADTKELLYRVMVLSELAGRAAVTADIDA